MNPLLQAFTTPHEVAPFDKIQVEHFEPAIDKLIREGKKDIQRIANQSASPTFENTIDELEKNGDQLGRVVELLFNLNHAETNQDLQEIAQKVSPKLADYSSQLWMHPVLFERVKRLHSENLTDSDTQDDKDTRPILSKEQLTVLKNYYESFLRNGAELKGGKKDRFTEIKSELSKITLKFSENVLAETNAFALHLTWENDLEGLPEFVREAAALEAKNRDLDGWVFTLHHPSFVPFMKYARNRALRKKMFMAFSFRGNQNNKHDNKGLITQIVNLRLELAHLLNESDYASYVLKKRMAATPEKVINFLNELHVAARPFAQDEYAEIHEWATSHGHPGAVERWDWAYWSEEVRKAKYDIREEEIKPFFELAKVTADIFELAKRLYGVEFKENQTIPVYHDEVQAYEVFDNRGNFLAIFYTDFFPRKGKQGGAWMTDFKGQDKLGTNQRPHVSIVCNFTRPTAEKPSLLTFDEVNTYLHEFGHALHGILSDVTYPSVSGTNVFRDFVELPSQIMENWLTEKEWLDEIAVHYVTGEKMPEELLTKLIDARNFQAGYLTERQLSFGYTDMAWHSLQQQFDGDLIHFEKKAMAATELFPEVPGYCMSTAFSHIFAGGYAAGYYGYKWAEVLDADAFSLFKEKGIFNKNVADSFRENILVKGGSEDPMDLYKRFRGQAPSIRGLLERSGLVG